MTRKTDRAGTWTKKRSLPAALMDARAVWYPEVGGYAVCSITDGTVFSVHGHVHQNILSFFVIRR